VEQQVFYLHFASDLCYSEARSLSAVYERSALAQLARSICNKITELNFAVSAFWRRATFSQLRWHFPSSCFNIFLRSIIVRFRWRRTLRRISFSSKRICRSCRLASRRSSWRPTSTSSTGQSHRIHFQWVAILMPLHEYVYYYNSYSRPIWICFLVYIFSLMAVGNASIFQFTRRISTNILQRIFFSDSQIPDDWCFFSCSFAGWIRVQFA